MCVYVQCSSVGLIGDRGAWGQKMEGGTLQAVVKSLINMHRMAAACEEGGFTINVEQQTLLLIPPLFTLCEIIFELILSESCVFAPFFLNQINDNWYETISLCLFCIMGNFLDQCLVVVSFSKFFLSFVARLPPKFNNYSPLIDLCFKNPN